MAKILIANDDPATVEVLQRQLAASGHDCIAVSAGDQVISAAKTEGCALLIMDVMLPVLSGFEVCRRIRRDTDLYTMPILILSAMNGEEEVMHGLAQGADDYVTKPFNPNNLLQRVEALLRANSDASTDSMTGLSGADSTKRELQRRISSGEVFALVYAEVIGIREFAYKFGNDARRRAICLLGEMLQRQTSVIGGPAHVGHMGGGHFVMFLPQREVQAYCEAVMKAWKAELPGLYSALGLQRAMAEAQANGAGKGSLIDILLCVTVCERSVGVTAQNLFEVLSRVRHKALENKVGGVYVDRRIAR